MSTAALAPRVPCVSCELCAVPRGVLVHEAPAWRVIRVEDPDFPAFYRLIWRDHVTAFSALSPADRSASMAAIAAIDGLLRDALAPDRVNIASLGNFVPHLHWHVVARFEWDSRFPQPIWCAPERSVLPSATLRLPVALADLDRRLARVLAAV